MIRKVAERCDRMKLPIVEGDPDSSSGRLAWERVVNFDTMGNANAAVTAIDKVLDQLSGCLNAEAARRVVELKIDAETQARVADLAEKANQGLLTPDEHEEYKSYVEVGDFIAILKRKAKRLLTSTNGV